MAKLLMRKSLFIEQNNILLKLKQVITKNKEERVEAI